MNHFMRVVVLSALLGGGSAWAENLGKADQKMLTDLAMANMAEIETAKLALQKTQSDRVKSFAQQMVDDHTKGLEEVRKVAAARSLTLPTELDAKHKAMANKLEKLSGDKFDRSYMEQAGVKAHKEAHQLVTKAESSATDSEVKALATRLQPTIHQHLNNAEQLTAAIKGNTSMGNSGTQGKTGSGGTSSGTSTTGTGTSGTGTSGTSGTGSTSGASGTSGTGTMPQGEAANRDQGTSGSNKTDSSTKSTTKPERR